LIVRKQFKRPIAVAPYSAWKRFADIRYAPAREIDVIAGTARELDGIIDFGGPEAINYGPDAAIYVGVTATAMICLQVFQSDQHGARMISQQTGRCAVCGRRAYSQIPLDPDCPQLVKWLCDRCPYLYQ
jgi:hypothetical protein